MIRVRVVEPEQLSTQFRRPLLSEPVIRWPDQEPPPRPFFGSVRQRHRRGDAAVRANQGAAAFVRVGFLAVHANRLVHTRPKREAHAAHSSWLQNVSDRYFSAPSGKTV